MRWEAFARRFAGTAVLSRPLMEAACGEPKEILAVQLSRWTHAGRLVKLARGRYLLPEPWAPAPPPAFVANEMVYPSYVSLAYALQFYDLIPEGVSLVTSVTPGRPRTIETTVGVFRYRHIQQDIFWGSVSAVSEGHSIRIASPEKAVLDFFYFETGPFSSERFESYRFQNLDRIDLKRLKRYAGRMADDRLIRAANWVHKAAG